jgi:hypothetical protein
MLNLFQHPCPEEILNQVQNDTFRVQGDIILSVLVSSWQRGILFYEFTTE